MRGGFGSIEDCRDGDDIGLDYIMESLRSSPQRATSHRQVAFKWVSMRAQRASKRSAERSEAKSVRWTLFRPWESPSKSNGSP